MMHTYETINHETIKLYFIILIINLIISFCKLSMMVAILIADLLLNEFTDKTIFYIICVVMFCFNLIVHLRNIIVQRTNYYLNRQLQFFNINIVSLFGFIEIIYLLTATRYYVEWNRNSYPMVIFALITTLTIFNYIINFGRCLFHKIIFKMYPNKCIYLCFGGYTTVEIEKLQQIAIDNLLFKSVDKYNIITNEFNTNCTICINNYNENDNIIKLNCGHMYHPKCLIPWLQNQMSCPICKEIVENSFFE